MRLKSYFATTVESAMDRARQELGPDAMLVEAKDTPSESRHLGNYEVVFALTPAVPASQPPVAAEDPISTVRLASDLAELRSELDRLMQSYARAQRWNCSAVNSDGLSKTLINRLMSSGLPEGWAADFAADITGEARSRGSSVTAADLEGIAIDVLARRIPCAPNASAAGPRTIALIGPAGAGKTTMLAKLAIRLGLESRRSVKLLSADTDRIGAADQLRRFAALLAVPFELTETPCALERRLAASDHDLTLIDTPGLGPADLPDCATMLEVLASRKDVEKHLVIPAALSAASVAQLAHLFALAQPAFACLAHADEAASLGAPLGEILERRLAVSFISTGQRIPEDFETADPVRLASSIMIPDNHRQEVSAHAA